MNKFLEYMMYASDEKPIAFGVIIVLITFFGVMAVILAIWSILVTHGLSIFVFLLIGLFYVIYDFLDWSSKVDN